MLRRRDFNLALLDFFLEALLTLGGSLCASVCTLALFIVLLSWALLLLLLLFISSAEVDEFFAQIDLGGERVDLEFLKLGQLPLTLLLFLFLAASLLLSTNLGSLALTLFGQFLSLLVTLATLLLIFFLALSAFHNHLLRFRDPFDVLEQGLLDFIVAHATVEVLLGLSLLVPQVADLLEEFLNLLVDVDEVVLLELFALIKHRFALFDGADLFFELRNDFVRWSQLDLRFLSLVLLGLDLLADRLNLLQSRLGGLDLVNFLNESRLVRLGVGIDLKSVL